ncbi:MAG: MBL fold metallo-hydrolase [Nitrospirae bacterium]|nr:MBL fold metallo-hydrolase [Nitrospirota bacterium]MBI5695525.1 MBL fold metallo-hydrolase [Nitrospirota bacterium]
MILKTIIVGALAVNCYVAGCDKTRMAAVIDPGDDAAEILAVLKDGGLTLKYIILTHAHFDHSGAALELQKRTGAKVLIHKDDADMLSQTAAQGAMFGMAVSPPPKPDGYLKDGETLKVGELILEVIETPGHSKGGISVYARKEGAVFTGDTLFWGSVGRTDLPGGDYTALMHSLKVRLASLPDNTVVYPGHGDDTTIGFEKEQNPFLD